jgi:hypothetical protein
MAPKEYRATVNPLAKGIALFKVQAPKKKLMKLNLQIIVSVSAAPVLAFPALAQDTFACPPMRSEMRLAPRRFSKCYCEIYYPPGNSQDRRRIKTSYDNW